MSDFSVAPGVLVAMPELDDPNFHRSVVVMIEHDEQGALGLVLTNLTQLKAADVADGFGLPWAAPPELRLRNGGPVEPNCLWILHDDGWFFSESMRLSQGVAASRSKEALTRICEGSEAKIRLFVGYAGWGSGQLEAEIASGSWLVAPFLPEMVFEWSPDELWLKTLSTIGIDPAFLVGGGPLVQ